MLIVDDEQRNLMLLYALLKQQGYKVRVANTGQSALLAAQARLPDLILLDIKMPGMSGYELLKILKAESTTSEVPVIMVSALADIEDVVKAFKNGCVDYITKPFHDDEVLIRVENHLKIKRCQLKLLDSGKELEKRVRERTRELEQTSKKLQLYQFSLDHSEEAG
ncbi:MAG: response regulator [Candidatus Electrothrix sp. ATG1]|nr:response regulator [Candidatus Electrothrix sp. ATG1]